MSRSDVLGLARTLLPALVLSGRPAFAAPPSELAVSASGQCPAAERVQRQLIPLLAETNVLVVPQASAEVVLVADDGERFRVKLRDVERVIENPARDCEERARIAAVLVALVVDPPLPARDTIVEPEPAPPPAPPPFVSGPSWATLAGATAALAPASVGSRIWGAGPLLAALLGQAEWEVSISAAFISPVRLDLESGGVRLTRFPLNLSGSWLFGSPDVRGVMGAGLAGDLLLLTGTRVSQAQSSLRFDVGLRSHVGFRFRFGTKVWGFAEVNGTFFPRPYEFEVPPNGVVGYTPRFWLGGTFGALFEID